MKFLSFFTGLFKSTTIEKVSGDVKETVTTRYSVKKILIGICIIVMGTLAIVHGDKDVIATTINNIGQINKLLLSDGL